MLKRRHQESTHNMLVLFSIFAFAATAAGQLQFMSSQTGREVDIRCSIRDLQSTQISSIISMVILRSDKVIVSVAPVVGTQPVIHDLDGAMVTTGMGQDVNSETFINIHWPMANDTLEDDYTCELNGLNLDFQPVSVTAYLSLMLEDTDPALLISPLVVEEGLTTNLRVRCSMLDPDQHDLSEVLLMELFHSYEGIDQLIASVSAFSGVDAQPASGWTAVTGYVGTNDQENFLEANWPFPTVRESGSYSCDINGLQNATEVPMFFTREINVSSSEPSRQQLIDRIHHLDALYNSASLEIQNLIDEIRHLNDTLYYMQDWYVFACTFEKDFCGLSQDTSDRWDWRRNNGPTSSDNTGPNVDHTHGTADGYYVYFEASAPAQTNQRARLLSEEIYSPHRSICINFYYHMYGNKMGTFNIRLKQNDTLGAPIWTRSGNQGQSWKEVSLELAPDPFPYMIVFEAVRGSDIQGDIAIDDLVISDLNCATGNDTRRRRDADFGGTSRGSAVLE